MNKFKFLYLIIISLLLGCKSQPTENGIPNFGFVDRDKNILRGGQPNNQGFDDLKKRGITIDIKLNPGRDEYAEKLGIKVIYVPITTCEQIFGNNLQYKIPLAASYITSNTYIHCTFGKNRTGTLIGYYLINYENYNKKQALNEMDFYGWEDSFPGLKWYFFNLYE